MLMKLKMYVRFIVIRGLLSLPTPMGDRDEDMYVCKLHHTKLIVL